MPRFVEFGLVRLLEPHTGEGHYEDNGLITLPAGAIGTITHIHEDDFAFEVEFTLRPPKFDDDNELIEKGTWHCVSLTVEQIEPLSPEEASKMG